MYGLIFYEYAHVCTHTPHTPFVKQLNFQETMRASTAGSGRVPSLIDSRT